MTCHRRAPQRTLDVHVDVYDADGRMRKPSAASRLFGSASSLTAPWARRSTPVRLPLTSRTPATRLRRPPVRLLACAPLPRHHRCGGHHLSSVLARTTQVRKSRRLAAASALSRGGPAHRLEAAAPLATRAAHAHAASLARQSRASRGARGEREGEEGEEEAHSQEGAVAVPPEEACAVPVGAPDEPPQPSCRGASPPVRVH